MHCHQQQLQVVLQNLWITDGASASRQDVLGLAADAAKQGLELSHGLKLSGAALRNFGTALRTSAVRALLVDAKLRDTDLLKVLSWISAAADAHRHWTAGIVNEAIAMLQCLLQDDSPGAQGDDSTSDGNDDTIVYGGGVASNSSSVALSFSTGAAGHYDIDSVGVPSAHDFSASGGGAVPSFSSGAAEHFDLGSDGVPDARDIFASAGGAALSTSSGAFDHFDLGIGSVVVEDTVTTISDGMSGAAVIIGVEFDIGGGKDYVEMVQAISFDVLVCKAPGLEALAIAAEDFLPALVAEDTASCPIGLCGDSEHINAGCGPVCIAAETTIAASLIT